MGSNEKVMYPGKIEVWKILETSYHGDLLWVCLQADLKLNIEQKRERGGGGEGGATESDWAI